MEIKLVTSDKKEFLELLLLADEQESMIDRYLERGDMFVLYDNGLKALCVVTREGEEDGARESHFDSLEAVDVGDLLNLGRIAELLFQLLSLFVHFAPDKRAGSRAYSSAYCGANAGSFTAADKGADAGSDAGSASAADKGAFAGVVHSATRSQEECGGKRRDSECLDAFHRCRFCRVIICCKDTKKI